MVTDTRINNYLNHIEKTGTNECDKLVECILFKEYHSSERDKDYLVILQQDSCGESKCVVLEANNEFTEGDDIYLHSETIKKYKDSNHNILISDDGLVVCFFRYNNVRNLIQGSVYCREEITDGWLEDDLVLIPKEYLKDFKPHIVTNGNKYTFKIGDEKVTL